jgi:predicted RNase H-like HicB family nuclease
MAGSSRYEIIIFWSDEDGSFVAEVPELPGCMADGATYQEAVANTESAIRDWLDMAVQLGRSIPKPKGRLQYA